MATLAEYCKRPLKVSRDLSQVPTPLTVQQLNNFIKTHEGDSRIPEHDALRFYMMNHAFACIQEKLDPEEPLGEYQSIADSYFSESCEATARAFYYLLLICTRESRHVKNASDIRGMIESKHGKGAMLFNDSIRGSGSTEAANKLRNSPPNIPLGRFTESLVDLFFQGKYSSAYGGKKWGEIAKCLNEFVWGRTSAEMMMDTVWTLSHNNGPIFNKGMLYKMYSDELIVILDVQRAGQIPQLMHDCSKGVDWITKFTSSHLDLWNKVVNLFPDDFTGNVDWKMVKDLGSVKSYDSNIQKSEKVFGVKNIITTDTQQELYTPSHTPIYKPEKIPYGPKNYFKITPKESYEITVRPHH